MNKISDIFSETEIQELNRIINDAEKELDSPLGRVKTTFMPTKAIIDSLHNKLGDLVDSSKMLSSVSYVEYNSLYGEPNLPPHYDADETIMLVNYQLSANTKWDLGLNTDVYSIEDNSAVIFNPNENIHWRPVKKFKDGESVRMIFFRFRNTQQKAEYSHLNYSQNNPIFEDAIKAREAYNV